MTEKSSQNPISKNFTRIAAEVEAKLSGQTRTAAENRDTEWQRVNSYVADVLKDAHVLYSKIARLQSDFTGSELGHLEKIGERVLDIGEELSKFMKSFHEGDFRMVKDIQFGGGAGAPPGTPPPAIPAEFQEAPARSEDDYEGEIRKDDEGEFEEYKGEEEKPEKGEEAA
jgi:hypothetical protein